MQGGIEIFLKAVRGCLCFIEVKDTAGRVVGRNLGSHCPVPCLPLSGLPSLTQYVSKILVALSNGSKPAAFRGGRQAEERGRGLRQGQLVGAAVAQKERGGGRLGVPTCGLLQVPTFRQTLPLCHLVLRQLHPTARPCSQREQESRSTNKLPPWKASCSRSLHVY